MWTVLTSISFDCTIQTSKWALVNCLEGKTQICNRGILYDNFRNRNIIDPAFACEFLHFDLRSGFLHFANSNNSFLHFSIIRFVHIRFLHFPFQIYTQQVCTLSISDSYTLQPNTRFHPSKRNSGSDLCTRISALIEVNWWSGSHSLDCGSTHFHVIFHNKNHCCGKYFIAWTKEHDCTMFEENIQSW